MDASTGFWFWPLEALNRQFFLVWFTVVLALANSVLFFWIICSHSCSLDAQLADRIRGSFGGRVRIKARHCLRSSVARSPNSCTSCF